MPSEGAAFREPRPDKRASEPGSEAPEPFGSPVDEAPAERAAPKGKGRTRSRATAPPRRRSLAETLRERAATEGVVRVGDISVYAALVALVCAFLGAGGARLQMEISGSRAVSAIWVFILILSGLANLTAFLSGIFGLFEKNSRLRGAIGLLLAIVTPILIGAILGE